MQELKKKSLAEIVTTKRQLASSKTIFCETVVHSGSKNSICDNITPKYSNETFLVTFNHCVLERIYLSA